MRPIQPYPAGSDDMPPVDAETAAARIQLTREEVRRVMAEISADELRREIALWLVAPKGSQELRRLSEEARQRIAEGQEGARLLADVRRTAAELAAADRHDEKRFADIYYAAYRAEGSLLAWMNEHREALISMFAGEAPP